MKDTLVQDGLAVEMETGLHPWTRKPVMVCKLTSLVEVPIVSVQVLMQASAVRAFAAMLGRALVELKADTERR